MFSQKIIFLSFFALCLVESIGLAEDKSSTTGIFQRASQRETKRWTLQEWLETKEKNRMMDLWLALNSPSPYEGIFGIHYLSYQTSVSPSTSSTSYTGYSAQLAAYASLVGLGIEFTKLDSEKLNDLTGLFNFRIFGNSVQSTHITLHLGQRVRSYSTSTQDFQIRNLLGQISLQIYFSRFFGIDNYYRVYQNSDYTNLGLGVVGGQSLESGFFIDYSAFRIFIDGCIDVQTQSLNSVETRTERVGLRSGFRLFY